MARMRIKVPETANQGEIIELKVLIQHPMESGYRRDSKGEAIPRNILSEFECVYGKRIIFTGEFGPGMAANPILTFHAKASESGTITFRWTEQTGKVFEDTKTIDVI